MGVITRSRYLGIIPQKMGWDQHLPVELKLHFLPQMFLLNDHYSHKLNSGFSFIFPFPALTSQYQPPTTFPPHLTSQAPAISHFLSHRWCFVHHHPVFIRSTTLPLNWCPFLSRTTAVMRSPIFSRISRLSRD